MIYRSLGKAYLHSFPYSQGKIGPDFIPIGLGKPTHKNWFARSEIVSQETMPTLISPHEQVNSPEMSPTAMSISLGGVEFILSPTDIDSEVVLRNTATGVIVSLEKFSGSLKVSLQGVSPGAAPKSATVEEDLNSPQNNQNKTDCSSRQQKLSSNRNQATQIRATNTKKNEKQERKRGAENKIIKHESKKTRLDEQENRVGHVESVGLKMRSLRQTMEAAKPGTTDLHLTHKNVDSSRVLESGTGTHMLDANSTGSIKEKESAINPIQRAEGSKGTCVMVREDYSDSNSDVSAATAKVGDLAAKNICIHTSKESFVAMDCSEESSPAVPCPRWGHTLTQLQDNRLLLYGGQSFDLSGNPTILSDVHVYDISERMWCKSSQSNGEARQWHSATYVPRRNILIAFGGETMHPIKKKLVTSDTVRVLDIDIMLWYPPAVSGDIPGGRSGHTLSHVPGSNDLVLFGGVRGSKWLNNICVLDTTRWVWTLPKVQGLPPKPRSYHSATIVVGQRDTHMLVIFGGNNKADSFNSVHVLEMREEGWKWSHPCVTGKAPSPRTGHSAVLLQDGKTINIYGGWDPNVEDSEAGEDCIHKSSFLLDTKSWTWRVGPRPTSPASKTGAARAEDCGPKRCGHAACLRKDNGDIIVFGGRIPGERLAGDLQIIPYDRKLA